MSEQGKKRPKSYFYNQKKRKNSFLEPGQKGFLGFCNFREKDCIKEAINLLNEYSDIASAKVSDTASEVSSALLDNTTSKNIEDNSEDIDDIEDALSNEIEAVKKENLHAKRFQVVESGAKNILFIRSSIEDPVQIASTIMHDILETKEQKTRFLLRLVPVEITCKANLNDIKESTVKLVDRYFSDEPKTFSVVYNHRNNSNLNRDEIIKEIATIVINKSDKHVVNLKEPSLAVIVEIIRGICLLAVVPDYMKCKKYNLHQLCDKSVQDKKIVVNSEIKVQND